MIEKAGLYWRTVRHLRPYQIYGRLWFTWYTPRLPQRSLPTMRQRPLGWLPPAARPGSMLSSDTFRFLNQVRQLRSASDWNDSTIDKLWLYNLHYFDDLNAEDASSRHGAHLVLLQRWVTENPPTSGNGWEPYPTSLRIVNWIKWTLGGHELPEACRDSLALQARWLALRLERHLGGNHLFANAKALVFAGLAFQGPEADGWLRRGLQIIARELPVQILPDGANYERSTMYHSIFLEDVIDLINAAGAWSEALEGSAVTHWREITGPMLSWLRGMSHPDGEIGLFNDAAIGVAPTYAALLAYAARLGLSERASRTIRTAKRGSVSASCWPESGYVRLEAPSAVALLDVGVVGPDELPGHAHADTLSFELSLHGVRVLVNGGTSRYGTGPERLKERQTAAHSTVEVAGRSSSEVWGGFRVARRARTFGLSIEELAEGLRVICSHDGYAHLQGRPVHRREWRMQVGTLRLADRVSGGRHTAVARYVLHPDITLKFSGADTWELGLPGGQAATLRVRVGAPQVEVAHYAPEFGKVIETRCLAVKLWDGLAEVDLSWN